MDDPQHLLFIFCSAFVIVIVTAHHILASINHILVYVCVGIRQTERKIDTGRVQAESWFAFSMRDKV